MSKRNNKLKRLKRKYPTIRKGKAWWKGLTKEEKKSFTRGFIENKHAEEIQKLEIKSNKIRRFKN